MMQRIAYVWIVAACLGAVPTLAAADTFMLVSGVPGDSVEASHKGWIRVSDLDWPVKAQTSWTQGGGASVGKPIPDKLQLTLPTGTWSSEFLRFIAKGQAFPTITIDHVGSDGRLLYRMKVDNVFVTQYAIAAPANALPQDYVEAVFQLIRMDFYTYFADGRKATTAVEWNVSLGTVK